MSARTLFDKVWTAHEVVAETADTPAVLYVDLHLIHEVTSPQAFSVLRSMALPVRRPDRTLATMDHSTPTVLRPAADGEVDTGAAAKQVRQLEKNAAEFGVELFDMKDARRGIVHVISPELGATQPGMTIVCGDSHTSTHGAFGALAFGIGSTEVGHVFATQCLLQRKPKTFAINVEGSFQPGVTAKDLILAIIGKVGVSGGTGYVFEYRGSTIRGLSMEERMTMCNMSIEAGARAGMIAPDEVTFAYLKDRPRSPKGPLWDEALVRWRALASDPDAVFDASIDIDAGTLEPMITYGTNPGMVVSIAGTVPRMPVVLRKPCSTRRSPTWAFMPAKRCWASRSMWCSSAVAPTGASRISRPPPVCSRAARSRRGSSCSSFRARNRSSARPRPRASPRFSRMRARTGGSRVAPCVSA